MVRTGHYHLFMPLFPNTSIRIILKKPKTDSSIRKVWLPKTPAYILQEWKSAQDELRALLRDKYQDYDLVVALANGHPCEDRIILKEFEKLREKAGRHGPCGDRHDHQRVGPYPGRGPQDQRPEV